MANWRPIDHGRIAPCAEEADIESDKPDQRDTVYLTKKMYQFSLSVMKISTQSRYGLRALFDIAYHSNGQSTQVRDIAARQDISPRYLEQIFQKLKRGGIIESIRGPSGGYRLAMKAGEITIGDVIRAAEGPIELVLCKNGKNGAKLCQRAKECVTSDIWKEASSRLMGYFDSVTLEDLCKEAQAKGVERAIDKSLMFYI